MACSRLMASWARSLRTSSSFLASSFLMRMAAASASPTLTWLAIFEGFHPFLDMKLLLPPILSSLLPKEA